MENKNYGRNRIYKAVGYIRETIRILARCNKVKMMADKSKRLERKNWKNKLRRKKAKRN